MAFTAKTLLWRFRHLNIAGCLLKRRPSKGGSRAPPPPLATPLHWATELKKWGIVIAFPCDLPRVTTVTKRFLSDTKTASVDH